MRAAVFRNGQIMVDTMAEPTPGPGQVLVKPLACGICGTDLHARLHAGKMVEMSQFLPWRKPMDLTRDVVFGHEYCCEILDCGWNCMQTDQQKPMLASYKELTTQYVLACTPDEFAQSLTLISSGKVDVGAMITGKVGLDEVATAFDELAGPNRHAKIVVEPWR